MGIFDNIGGVDASRDSNYIRPGMYVVQIDRVKQDESRKKVEFIAVEMTNLKTVGSELQTLETGEEVNNSHHEGEQMSHLIMSNQDMFLPNVKAMVMALIGCSEDEVNADACALMVSDVQPMAGLIVLVHAREIATRAGKPFTKVGYKHTLSKAEFEKYGINAPRGAKFAEDLAG